MPFESFIQLIKKIINMSNFRSPAFQICHFWSMRAAFLLVDGSVDLQDDVTQYSSALQFDLSDAYISLSRVLLSVRAHDERWPLVYATRNVRSFERGALQVRSNDWVLVCTTDGAAVVGRVGEIVELVASGGSFMRLHLCEVRPIRESFDPMRGQRLSVLTSVAASEQIVCVERASFHEVYCDDSREGELQFTYIY
jgi:hypothetical protein